MNKQLQSQHDNWWRSELGRALSLCEREQLARLAPIFTGDIQLQIGGIDAIFPDTEQATIRRLLLARQGDVYGAAEALPFQSNSIDYVILQHVLEYADDAHQVLREVDRVLTADGIIVVCSFNPLSLWGIRRYLPWQRLYPWTGHFFSQQRINDWLALLNFAVIEQHKLLFRPPLRKAKWFKRLLFLESVGQRFWPFFSSVSIMVARKRTIPLNPLRQERQRRVFTPPHLINTPITRNNNHGSR